MTGYRGHRFDRATSGAFTPKTRGLIRTRDQDACARCGATLGLQIHHRRARGMGGGRDPLTASPANGVLLCGPGSTDCHGWVEGNPTSAYRAGWKVRQGIDPTTVPVLHVAFGWVQLDEDGGVSRMGVGEPGAGSRWGDQGAVVQG